MNKLNKKRGFTQHHFPKWENSSGFTLIEMMVSLSIFTIVITVALGSLLTLIDANKKSQAIQSLMTNLNFVVDDISRNARVGSTYHCENDTSPNNVGSTSNCSSGGVLLAFESSGGSSGTTADQVIYRYINNSIEKSTNGGSTFTRITDDEIDVEYMRFYVVGSTVGDDEQPRVLIVLRGTAGAQAKTQTEFSIQTTITQRLFDD